MYTIIRVPRQCATLVDIIDMLHSISNCSGNIPIVRHSRYSFSITRTLKFDSASGMRIQYVPRENLVSYLIVSNETMPITRTNAWHLLLSETVAQWEKRDLN